MKSTALVIAVSAILAAQSVPAHACDNGGFTLRRASFNSPARLADRHDSRDARVAITTENGQATLILTDDVVAAQLSDRVLSKIDRKLSRERYDDDDNNVLARTIKTAVLSSVRNVLDHSAECSIRDIRDVEYRRGRLIFTTEDGDRLFEDIEVGDRDMMEGFSESDARAFVREFHRMKNRIR